jgi:hypothetical protein
LDLGAMHMHSHIPPVDLIELVQLYNSELHVPGELLTI